MSKLYHFCAMSQKKLGSMEYSDGVIVLKYMIESYDFYQKMKNEIAKEFFNGVDGSEIIITSLSLIGKKDEE